LCLVNDRGGYNLAELSVIADAVTTPYQAILRSDLRAGDLAVFVGVGGVGTFGVQIAAAMGAHVVAIDVVAERLCAIANCGAKLTLDASVLDGRSIRKQVAGAAADWGLPAHSWKIFECSGHRAGQETAFGLITYASTLMVIGFTLDLRLVTSGAIAVKPFIECHPLATAPTVLERVANHEIHRRPILVPDLRA
jgi:6-hydroxycyclohex-1-ene-1-carbonyl-CoA dehydrogenase